MSERFFSAAPITGDTATLADQEAHHLLHVMRLKVGAGVTLFDGSGAEFAAEVRQTGRRALELAVLSRREVDRELRTRVTIATALPKGDRQRWLVEKLTELGAARLQILEAERSVAKLTSSGLEKLRRAVIEASKQCGRNRLMEIGEPIALTDYLAGAAVTGVKLFAHPTGQPMSESPAADQATTVVVGPEGGFSDAEVALAEESGWASVSLGARIMRTETAAVSVAACLAMGLAR